MKAQSGDVYLGLGWRRVKEGFPETKVFHTHKPSTCSVLNTVLGPVNSTK